MNEYKFSDAKCPYFGRIKYTKLTCGELDGARVALNFANAVERDSWYEDLCCESYEKCMMYRLLEDAYVEK